MFICPRPVRLDQFLTAKAGIKSRGEAQRLIQAGLVTVNGKVLKKASAKVSEIDKLEWKDFPVAPVPKAAKVSVKLPVLFEDNHCMVINKPAGVSVHPGSGMEPDEETILSALKPLFRERKLPFSEPEILVHRLDKETTGCLLIAKNPKAHLALQKQFADRTVSKTYLAFVSGIPSPAAAMIDAPIGRNATNRTTMSVLQATAAREARTTYRTLGTAKGAALLACELHTGRTHQIRVHLKSIGHPILGDTTYNTDVSGDLAVKLDIDFLCLHAWKLEFKSPSGKKVAVKCPPLKNLAAVLKKLKIAV